MPWSWVAHRRWSRSWTWSAGQRRRRWPSTRPVSKETKEETIVDTVVDRDDCNRPDTTLEGLAKLKPVRGEGHYITAGNASQLSDGAAAVVLMEAAEAERRGLTPMGAFRGWTVAGCEPDEMGIGPVFAVPKLLNATASASPASCAYGGSRARAGLFEIYS